MTRLLRWPPVLAFVACLLGAAAVSAQTSASYNIAGRLVNAVSGEPVRRATVSVLSETDSQAIQVTHTDEDGHFALNGLPAGKYPLTAAKRGYRTSYFNEHDEFNTAIVTGPDQDTTHLEFQLPPAGVIAGVITADGGDPVEGAQIMLFRRPPATRPWERIRQLQTVMTDDAGNYEFDDLDGGDYLIAVKAQPWYAMRHTEAATASGEPSPLDVAYPTTFFDSTTDESAASAISLSQGEHQEANITLHAVPALHIRFDMPIRQGAGPLTELREPVFGIPMPTGGWDLLQVGSRFDLSGIAPGHYELTHGDPPRTVDVHAASDIEVNSDSGIPAVPITGRVVLSDGEALPESLFLTLQPAEAGSGQSLQNTAISNGTFRIESAAPGRWLVNIFKPGESSLTVLSVSAGTSTHTGNEIVVKDRSLDAVITVSRTQRRIQGFARLEGKPASGVMVLLVPKAVDAYASLLRRDQSDSDGSFSLRNVPAGSYTVIAIQEGWKLNWQDPAVLSRFLPQGIPVTVSDRDGAVLALSHTVPVSTP